MKIIYDYQAFTQIHGGISRYYCEIIQKLRDRIEINISIFYSDNTYLRKLLPKKTKKLITRKYFKGKDSLSVFINKIYTKFYLIFGQYDLLHITHIDGYAIKYSKTPFVITIHDLTIEKNPEYFIKNYSKTVDRTAKLIKSASHIIAVSENTKSDLIEFYKVSPEKVTVIYHGVPKAEAILENSWGEYILFVGNRNGYKNFRRFMEAIAPLLTKNKRIKVLCVGKSFSKEENLLFKNLGIIDQVKNVKASDQLLYTLYAHAICFVYPSVYEGFGIPILEAFSYNCPVCLSNASCFPEIAGEAAVYFDPFDKSSIYEAVKTIIDSPNLQQELKIKGKKRLKIFSWDIAAAQTLKVYKKINNKC